MTEEERPLCACHGKLMYRAGSGEYAGRYWECSRDRNARWYQANKEKAKANVKAWQAAHRKTRDT